MALTVRVLLAVEHEQHEAGAVEVESLDAANAAIPGLLRRVADLYEQDPTTGTETA